MSHTPIEDESWSDLAAELGVGSSHQPKPPPLPPPIAPEREPYRPRVDPSAEASDPELDIAGDEGPDAEGEPDDTVVIPALSGEPMAEATAGESAEPGKKRRRRRRRRKKGGAAGQPADANGPVEGGPVAEDDADDLAEAAPDEEPNEPADADEPTAEAARDVIANWNVPSWEQIVAGLYRPER
jgi:ribonuclease E